jgi:NADP-dependent aldehyde dehydrogenase
MQDEKSLFAEVDAVVLAAAGCADGFAGLSPEERSKFLAKLADRVHDERETLTALAMEETHLPRERLLGELARTCFQLNVFSKLLASGAARHTEDDPAIAGAAPEGRPHLIRIQVPIGPVAVFSASNFPFAFSVLGGDTVSALAAGCPVVVKPHGGHPRLSRRVWEVAQQVLRALGLPGAILGLLPSHDQHAGVLLVQHPSIRAVAFTGSLAGGRALQALAANRANPIPFYGELGSVNPVVVLPAALQSEPYVLCQKLAASIAQSAGQLCTSPGLVVLLRSPESTLFVDGLAEALDTAKLHPMLSRGMRASFDAGVRVLREHQAVQTLTSTTVDAEAPTAYVGKTDAKSYIKHAELRHEIFGSACLCVIAESMDEMISTLRAVEGSLTVTIWGANTPTPEFRELYKTACAIAGRVLFDGVPTGVAVTRAQNHGGPWPASTQSLHTSVGHHAIDRFLRPVALQDPPDWVTASANP